MSAEILTPLLALAAKAGNKVVEWDTFIPLLDADPLTSAEFLSVRSWKRRAAWFDSIIIDSFNRATQVVEQLELETQEARDLLRDIVAGMRKQITETLDHLDRLAPLPLDEEAMRVFRVCDDPERVALAVRYWRDEDAELAALRAASGCMMLRNISIAPYGAPAVRKAWGLE